MLAASFQLTDDRLGDCRFRFGQRHQARKPDEILIRGALVIGRNPPCHAKLSAIPDGKNSIGVAAVDCQKHGITF